MAHSPACNKLDVMCPACSPACNKPAAATAADMGSSTESAAAAGCAQSKVRHDIIMMRSLTTRGSSSSLLLLLLLRTDKLSIKCMAHLGLAAACRGCALRARPRIGSGGSSSRRVLLVMHTRQRLCHEGPAAAQHPACKL
jgi:hypothetical protein